MTSSKFLFFFQTSEKSLQTHRRYYTPAFDLFVRRNGDHTPEQSIRHVHIDPEALMTWMEGVLFFFFIGISVRSNKYGGEADSNSVDSHGLRESINFNKLSLLSEKGVGALDYVSLHLQFLTLYELHVWRCDTAAGLWESFVLLS